MNEPTFPLAPNPVFRTLQGEGAMLGLPMVFVRLAGCSVGCEGCDTDYRVASRATAAQLKDLVSQRVYGGVRWAWVTGGEPLDHDLAPLVLALRELGLRVALATAGTKPARLGLAWGGVDFTSVSPHSADASWVQRSGCQLNLVPGLNGLSLSDPELLDALKGCERAFSHRYVTPLAGADGQPTNLEQCRRFVEARVGWRLGVQAHKVWGVA